MKNTIVYTFLIIVIITLAVFNVITVKRVSDRPEPVDPPVLNESPVRVYGIVEPSGKPVVIHPHVPGTVREILVSDGDTVRAGQLLCALKNSVELAQLEAAEARVSLGRKEAELSRDQYKRNTALRADGSISEADYVRLKIEKELKEEQIALYMKELELARARLDELEIRSPMDGIVYFCDIRPGEYFGIGEGERLVVSSKALQVRCDVEVIWIDRLARGATYSVLNAETGQRVGKAIYSYSSRYLRGKRFATEDPKERMSSKYQEVIMEFVPDDTGIPVQLPVMVEMAD